MVVARREHGESDDDLAFRVGGELDVVGRPVAAIGHLHHLGLMIGRRGAGLVGGLAGTALGGLELGQVGEGATDPLGSLGRRPFAGRDHPPRGGRGVVIELGLECRDLGLGLREEALEGGPAAIRRGSRPGPDPHPVLGHGGHGHQAIGEQGRDALGEELVEDVGVVDPEGGEGVVVHPDPTSEPAVGVVLGAQAIERPGRADRLERGVQPQRGQDRRVDRRSPGVALDRLDPIVQRAEIEPLDERPDEARPVVGRQETVEIDRTKLELATVGTLQPGRARSEFRGLRWISGWEREEGVVHAGNRSCDDLCWESPGTKDSQPLRHLNIPANLPLEIEITGAERWLRCSTA